MVSGVLDAGFQMSAFVQNGSLTFAVHHKTGTAYFSEKSVDALVHYIHVAANKEKKSED